MGLEAATFIGSLVPANPDGADDKAEGDNHIRMMKSVLQATMPGLVGRMWRHQTKSSGYTVVANDNMTLLNCTAALTLALTAAATLGNGHEFMVHANGFDVVIDPNGAETINGAATLTVPSGVCALVLCDGTAFKVFIIPTVSPFTTGDMKLTWKSTADVSWVMMNDGTIGNAVSGGTARANADTEALFNFFYANFADGVCAVSGGRGANAAADYAANKTIALPKVLGRNIAIAGTGSGLTARALASLVGTETKTIAVANLPASGLSIPSLSVSVTTTVFGEQNQDGSGGNAILSGNNLETAINNDVARAFGGSGSTGTGTTGNMGSGTAMDTMDPRFHGNVMVKL
jgi:hypothetical protein